MEGVRRGPLNAVRLHGKEKEKEEEIRINQVLLYSVTDC
jgi:hypothetical protein